MSGRAGSWAVGVESSGSSSGGSFSQGSSPQGTETAEPCMPRAGRSQWEAGRPLEYKYLPSKWVPALAGGKI